MKLGIGGTLTAIGLLVCSPGRVWPAFRVRAEKLAPDDSPFARQSNFDRGAQR